MSPSQGLDKAREIYQHRDKRARELRAQGKKVIGYLDAHVPLEIIAAADLVPYPIIGDTKDPITRADACLETIMCPFVRSSFDLALKGRYEFLEGFVAPFSCDSIKRSYDVWRYFCRFPFSRIVMLPHTVHAGSHEFYRQELASFKRSLEKLVQQEISEKKLKEAIAAYDTNRSLLKELCQLRKPTPPLLSGAEMLLVTIASLSLPVEESNELLEQIVKEVKNRKASPPSRKARLLLWASHIDDPSFIQMMEESGANVVIDDMYLGTRSYWHNVEPGPDPLSGLVHRYLDKSPNPHIVRDSSGVQQVDLENRFSYIKNLAQDFGANGAILAVTRYCDVHGFELPDLRDYLQGSGILALPLEYDYTVASFASWKTRIQAFLEIIS